MAYSCRIFLKEECDGCGMCDEPRHWLGGVPFDEDYCSCEPSIYDDYYEDESEW